MIYTVTFNPSLDYIVQTDDFQLGKTNRTSDEKMLPGGKGINVSIVLGNLGVDNTALGFLAGFTGRQIETMLKDYPLKADFIHLPQGNSRINVKLKSIDGTEINGMGPQIRSSDLQTLKDRILALTDGDILILAGSIPQSIPDSIYRELMAALQGKQIRILVDATGDLLMKVLPYHPFLIKPNIHELGALFDAQLHSRAEAVPYARKLQEMGAGNVLVSLSGDGAILVDETGGVHESDAPKGKLINAVGSGDSMVAGFLSGWLETKDYHHAFFMGLSAGSASAFSENLATGDEIRSLYRTLT